MFPGNPAAFALACWLFAMWGFALDAQIEAAWSLGALSAGAWWAYLAEEEA